MRAKDIDFGGYVLLAAEMPNRFGLALQHGGILPKDAQSQGPQK